MKSIPLFSLYPAAKQGALPSALSPTAGRLLTALAASLVLHLGAALAVSHVFQPAHNASKTAQVTGTVSVELRTDEPVASHPLEAAKTAPPKPHRTLPRPVTQPQTPRPKTAVIPHPTQTLPPPVLPTTKRIAPVVREKPQITPAVPSPDVPQTTVQQPTKPSAEPIFPDRLAVPLPQGDLAANPELADRPRQLTPLTATPSPLPPDKLDEEEGRGGGTPARSAPSQQQAPVGQLIARAENGTSDLGGAGGGSGGGYGADTGTGAGQATGAGTGSLHGIPFGSPNGTANGDKRGGSGSNGSGQGAGGGGGSPPIRIVYVIDESGSMADDGKVLQVRKAMATALSELRPEDKFNIVFFSGEPRTAFASLRDADPGMVQMGKNQVETTDPVGDTNYWAALDRAFQQEGLTHIYFLSDGEPQSGITDPEELSAAIRKMNGGRVHILTAALGLDDKSTGFMLLKHIAEENGGTFTPIKVRKQPKYVRQVRK